MILLASSALYGLHKDTHSWHVAHQCVNGFSDIWGLFSVMRDLYTNHCGGAATQHNRLQCVCGGGLAILSWLNEVSNNMPEAMLETGHTHTQSHRSWAKDSCYLSCQTWVESWGQTELASLVKGREHRRRNRGGDESICPPLFQVLW